MTATLETIADWIQGGKLDEARQELKAAERSGVNGASLLFLEGLLLERTDRLGEALRTFDRALDADPDHQEAAFRSANLHDLLGDESTAIELYERCVQGEKARVNALLNLALLYEEAGRFRDAEVCLINVLAVFPNHVRAGQFLKSVRSSYGMVVDEQTQREREQRNAVMDVPVSDFELSVRSRNCLKQMNIRTIGDLLRIGETDLLSYKNFGETSLNEIKQMLTLKGLKLGQAVPAVEKPVPPRPEPVTSDAASILQKSVSELQLSVRSRKCLQRLGVATLGELTIHTEAELLATKNFGQTSLTEIRKQLTVMGLSLRQD